MFNITNPAENRVDIELSGQLDGDTMRIALDELIVLSESVTKGKMLYTITDFSFPTLEAIGVEFSRLPKLFSLVGKFDKCAVLCDQAWIRTAAEIEGAIIPGLSIKSFELQETDAAEAWLASED